MQVRIALLILSLWLGLVPLSYAADKKNPEDEEIPDLDVPAVPAPVKPPGSTPAQKPEPQPTQPTRDQPKNDQRTPQTPSPSQPTPPQQPTPTTATGNNPVSGTGTSVSGNLPATVTVPRAEWEAMRTRQDDLQRQIEELKQLLQKNQGVPGGPTAPAPIAPAPTVPAPGTPATNPEDMTLPGSEAGQTAEDTGTATPTQTGNRNYLLLPDISLIAQAKGLLSSDRRIHLNLVSLQ